jgi:hypothetical protein
VLDPAAEVVVPEELVLELFSPPLHAERRRTATPPQNPQARVFIGRGGYSRVQESYKLV